MLYTVTLSPENLINEKTVADWRFELKRKLLDKRGWRSDFSGKPITEATGCHMHEGIISRAKAPKNLLWHILIFHEINCFLLLPEEHIPKPPSREWCLQKAIEYYGHDVVKEWYYSLPYKGSRPFILE